ncbi:MAG: PIG-L family deacetylase, partial [Bacilli bacterium]|nr:PIG-L family deacetylase [Bacilli bacterium]
MDTRFKILFSIILIGGTGIFISNRLPVKVNKNINSLDLSDTNKLMIVAHPDDETIWGGAELLKDNYLVVCITCGNVKGRAKEFKKVMNLSNNKYIMFGYPDKLRGVRDDWTDHQLDIKIDLMNIINYKNWDLIVTHNPDGEYGHSHHKMTSKMVTDLTKNKDNLYYFGKYYKPSKINHVKTDLTKIDKEYIDIKKNKMIKKYKTQKFTTKKFSHMFDYENWIKAS